MRTRSSHSVKTFSLMEKPKHTEKIAVVFIHYSLESPSSFGYKGSRVYQTGTPALSSGPVMVLDV